MTKQWAKQQRSHQTNTPIANFSKAIFFSYGIRVVFITVSQACLGGGGGADDFIPKISRTNMMQAYEYPIVH